MRITFFGGADEVGASCTLIEIAGQRVLVDAGIRMSSQVQLGVEAGQLPDGVRRVRVAEAPAL